MYLHKLSNFVPFPTDVNVSMERSNLPHIINKKHKKNYLYDKPHISKVSHIYF